MLFPRMVTNEWEDKASRSHIKRIKWSVIQILIFPVRDCQ